LNPAWRRRDADLRRPADSLIFPAPACEDFGSTGSLRRVLNHRNARDVALVPAQPERAPRDLPPSRRARQSACKWSEPHYS